MKPERLDAAKQYQAALQAHLTGGRSATLRSAREHGSRAVEAGIQTLDLAKLHEHTLVAAVLPRVPPKKRPAVIRRAGAFFGAAITPTEKQDRTARGATLRLKKFIAALSARTVELAAANLELSLEVAQRKAAEQALERGKRHYLELLERSDAMQEKMRGLSRQALSAHEDERRRISRELHDVVAQTLTGINLRLATLRLEAAADSRGLDRKIARTQRLVENSVNIVHQFARELRPAVLDDLGLIPALHSYLKSFSSRTGIRARLRAFAAVERLDMERRTVLFRVAQEALTNVARHSQASQVEVSIERDRSFILMRIKDDGKAFDSAAARRRNGVKRLGLLGMKERVEMVGGAFSVVSTPGKGVTITAQISVRKPT